MLMMKKEPMMRAAIQTWTRRWTVDGLKTRDEKATISARIAARPSATQGTPSRRTGTMWWPAGVCCQLFATTIQIDENTDPRATIDVAKKCILGPTLFQPK